MEKHGDEKTGVEYPVGFTFSFAFAPLAIDSAECLSMSKGFETAPTPPTP